MSQKHDQPATFEQRLSALVSKEMADAHGDADRIGAVIERLTHATAFSIAIAAKGDPQAADTLLEGAESYLYETAAGFQRFGAFMGVAGRIKGSKS